MNLYVGNLDYRIKEEQLEKMFSEFGEVVSVKIITDKFTGRSKGYAFVEMSNEKDAQKAIKALNGKSVNNRELKVNKAQPRPEK